MRAPAFKFLERYHSASGQQLLPTRGRTASVPADEPGLLPTGSCQAHGCVCCYVAAPAGTGPSSCPRRADTRPTGAPGARGPSVRGGLPPLQACPMAGPCLRCPAGQFPWLTGRLCRSAGSVPPMAHGPSVPRSAPSVSSPHAIRVRSPGSRAVSAPQAKPGRPILSPCVRLRRRPAASDCHHPSRFLRRRGPCSAAR